LRSARTSGAVSKGGVGRGGKERGIQYRNDNPDQGAPVRIEECGKSGGGNRVRNEFEECQSWLRSADGN